MHSDKPFCLVLKYKLMVPKIILFDIDGTLLLTGGAGKIALEKCFERVLGISGAWGQTIPDGKTDPAIIGEIAINSMGRELFPCEYKRLCELYLRILKEELETTPDFRLLQGVPELLAELSAQRSLLIGLATGNFEEAAYLKLKRGNIRHFFSFGGYGSDSGDRAEFTQKAYDRGLEKCTQFVPLDNVYVVGDTGRDILAGKKIGAHTIAVASNRSTREELENYAPDHLLQDLSDKDHFLKVIGQK